MTRELECPPGTAFATSFQRLTGHEPFPWQAELFNRLRAGGACVVTQQILGLWPLRTELNHWLAQYLRCVRDWDGA